MADTLSEALKYSPRSPDPEAGAIEKRAELDLRRRRFAEIFFNVEKSRSHRYQRDFPGKKCRNGSSSSTTLPAEGARGGIFEFRKLFAFEIHSLPQRIPVSIQQLASDKN